MKEILLASLVLFAPVTSALADTIARWNFNSPLPDGNSATGTLNPSTGNGTASFVGGATNASSGQFAVGDTHSDPAGTTDNSAWNTSKYPAATATNKSAGVRFDVDTTGYENISISWYQQNSGTASRYGRLQYTLDGNNFTDADVSATYVVSVFTNKTVTLSAVTGAANNPVFGFRIVSEFESTATGSGAASYLATTTGSTYNGNLGTIRFDMLTVSGTVIPGANTPPTISSLSNQTVRVNQSTGALPLTVGDAEDPAGSLTLRGVSSNPGVISDSNVSFGGSGANRTLTVNATAQTGSSMISAWVIDSGGKSNSTSFTVTVLPLNTAPIISSIPPTNTLVDTAGPAIAFTISDLETTAASLTLSGSSANTGLVPNGNIVFGGSGSNRTLTLTPASGQTGVAPITVTVSDGTNTASSIFPLMVVPSAGVIFYEPFTYANGSILTNSGFLWNNRSGTLGECETTNGQLQITTTQTEDLSGPLIGGPYARSNSFVLYAAFKVTFLALPRSAPGLVAHFANGSTLRGRVYAGTTNAAAGFFRLFVANGSDTNTAIATDLSLNTPYNVVTRYSLDTATTTLWLNPVSESDPGVTASDAQSLVTIASYGFRQDADIGATLLVDDLKVGLSFAAVTGTNSVIVRPIPLNVQRSGNNLVLSWTNSTFALQSAPQAAGLYTNVPAASSPYTIGISGSAKFFRLRAN